MYKVIKNCVLFAAIIMMLAAAYMLISDEVFRTEEEEKELSYQTEEERQEMPETVGESFADSGGDGERKTEFVIIGSLPETMPEEARHAVEEINAGRLLDEATGMEELKGYYALTKTNMVAATDPESGEMSTEGGLLRLYVPNLTEGLQDVSILFCDCTDGQWQIIPAEEVDVQGKRVAVRLDGSGVVTTIYRKD